MSYYRVLYGNILFGKNKNKITVVYKIFPKVDLNVGNEDASN